MSGRYEEDSRSFDSLMLCVLWVQGEALENFLSLWCVFLLDNGFVYNSDKTNDNDVWPVRGGQKKRRKRIGPELNP